MLTHVLFESKTEMSGLSDLPPGDGDLLRSSLDPARRILPALYVPRPSSEQGTTANSVDSLKSFESLLTLTGSYNNSSNRTELLRQCLSRGVSLNGHVLCRPDVALQKAAANDDEFPLPFTLRAVNEAFAHADAATGLSILRIGQLCN